MDNYNSTAIGCPITVTTTTNATNINTSEMFENVKKATSIFEGSFGSFTSSNPYLICDDLIVDNFLNPNRKMAEKNGSIYIGNRLIMPSVKEIKVLRSKDKDVGIKVIFSDDSIEKAICDKEDVFSYDYGLAICIMKKLFSYMSNSDKFTGTYYFNKIMDLAFRNNLKTFEEKAREKAEKNKVEHKKTKNRLRKAKQKAAKREAEIEIQKEAYLRAMNEFEGRK